MIWLRAQSPVRFFPYLRFRVANLGCILFRKGPFCPIRRRFIRQRLEKRVLWNHFFCSCIEPIEHALFKRHGPCAGGMKAMWGRRGQFQNLAPSQSLAQTFLDMLGVGA